MRHVISGSIPMEIGALFQKLGYRFHEQKDGVFSFKRIIHERPFPRFHLYVRLLDASMELDLHIDQEHPRHEGNHREEWAYQGHVVKQEVGRLDQEIEKIKKYPIVLKLKPKRTFWQILTGR